MIHESYRSDKEYGDKPGVGAGERVHILATQPAIDDVDEDFFPNDEDRDEDHVTSQALGHVYASSGIRRCTRDDITQEIDWALIKTVSERLQLYNIVQGGRRFHSESSTFAVPPLEEPVVRRLYRPEEDEYPMEVVDAESLGGLSVHCFGRATGLQGGLVATKMSNVKIYGRKTFSDSWTVSGGCKCFSQNPLIVSS